MPGAPDFEPRSLLFVPADAERFIGRAPERGADLIVLDLEDGVAPVAKVAARAALGSMVQRLQRAGCTVHVRVNHDAALLAGDLAAAVASGADGIVMPKIEAAEQLVRLAAAIYAEELKVARPPASVRVVALIETPQGVLQAASIARASPRLVGICFGAEDFSAAMGIEPLPEGLSHPAQSVAIACAAAGVHPMGLPGSVGNFSDPEALRALALHARRIGIRGGVCIHPKQVDVLNDVFGGSAEEAAAAVRLLAVFDAAVAEGKGAIALDGRMVDVPIANRARLFLQRRNGYAARHVR